MKRVELKRKTRLKSKTYLRRKKKWRSKKKVNVQGKERQGRDWEKMGTESHGNAGGRCEMCWKPVELGTYPAHIIPRADKKHSSDKSWNIACMDVSCHNKFDLNRPRAIIKMIKDGGCPLLTRIQTHPKLKAYFDRLMDAWKFRQEQMGTV